MEAKQKPNLWLLLAVSALGALVGLGASHLLDKDGPLALPEYGGTFDYGFRAELTIDPDNRLEGEDGLEIRDLRWTWTFKNRSESPVTFRLPEQQYHFVYGYGNVSREFKPLPPDLAMADTTELAPEEEKKLSFRSSWLGDKLPAGQIGIEVVAEIDGKFYILACQVTVKEAQLPERAAAPEAESD